MLCELLELAKHLITSFYTYLNSVCLLKSVQHICRQKAVKIVTSKQRVSADCKIFDIINTFPGTADPVQRHIQGAASQIKYHDIFWRFQRQQVRRDLSRLLHPHKIINNSLRLIKQNVVRIFHIDPCLSRRIDRCLTLIRVKRCRNRDHNISQFLLKQPFFSGSEHTGQNPR